jgi:hypothetical protein
MCCIIYHYIEAFVVSLLQRRDCGGRKVFYKKDEEVSFQSVMHACMHACGTVSYMRNKLYSSMVS